MAAWEVRAAGRVGSRAVTAVGAAVEAAGVEVVEMEGAAEGLVETAVG